MPLVWHDKERGMTDEAPRAAFRAMDEATADDWKIIGNQYCGFSDVLAERVLDPPKVPAGHSRRSPTERPQHSATTRP